MKASHRATAIGVLSDASAQLSILPDRRRKRVLVKIIGDRAQTEGKEANKVRVGPLFPSFRELRLISIRVSLPPAPSYVSRPFRLAASEPPRVVRNLMRAVRSWNEQTLPCRGLRINDRGN